MNEKYSALFTPWKIGNVEIKNRIVQPSMGGTSLFGWLEPCHFDKEAAYQYLNFILRPEVQESMAKEFFTSPTNTQVKLDPALAADVPINGKSMSSIVQFDWAKVNTVGPIFD